MSRKEKICLTVTRFIFLSPNLQVSPQSASTNESTQVRGTQQRSTLQQSEYNTMQNVYIFNMLWHLPC
uniref:Uncharacterized protein n=1 Tax=Arion vulgaris TaxID=1028688 RepID=A0A0B6ZDE8_9EUPU